ncbi:hypothetical protein THRCLA_23275, partial [Thraustotheca clavata]
ITLYYAASRGMASKVQAMFLTDIDANFDEKRFIHSLKVHFTQDATTTLSVAALNGHHEVVMMLTMANANVNAADQVILL